ncbi:S9 family peptidase [Sandaracinobacter sp. RS1-74]|nr:S9 family peptidase [Sandaracinobacteroides sayramensis]MCG2841436.1 S9 family peptidase [Sandaracinobacteroides sayramensis]
MQPPIARRGDHRFTLHGITVEDPYAWLRDKDYPKVDDPEVLAYLKAENAYFEDRMRDASMLTEALFEQMKGRIKEDDSSVPHPDGDWLYWWAFDPNVPGGSQYRNWYRKPRAGGEARIILSEPALAEGKEYFRLGEMQVSPDGKLIAWSADTNGSERFVLKVRDIATGQDLETVAEDSLGSIAWSSDSKSLVWAQASAEWRPTKIWLKKLGAARSALLYEEKEAGYWVQPSLTQDRKHILLSSFTQMTNEIRLLDAADPAKPARLVRPRKENVRYSIDARGDTLFVLTNDEHVNFRIATARLADPGVWTTLVAGSDEVYLTDITAFTSYLAVEERVSGLDNIRLIFPDGTERRVQFPEASYTASLGSNAEADAPELRIGYSSMVTPNTVFDYRVANGELATLKVQEIPSGYDASQYATERLIATGRDGTKVPVSIVYKKGYKKDGSQPLHVYGYGSYGIAMPPAFSSTRLSLLDRGFAYAIAHIRGGDDLGYQWYLDGKLEKRENTFNDFVDATRFLNKQGFGRPGFNSASGGSAGGWLMGAVVNQAPELWGAIVAHVPFVDIVNTMLDETLPLTPGEWPEWGDPRQDEVVLKRLIRLSPYEQTVARAYPPMLITGGLSDPRVTYWEPAKWAARLRAVKTDDNLLLLKINMGAGHGGKSGRYDRLRETAEEYAFILMALDGQAKA